MALQCSESLSDFDRECPEVFGIGVDGLSASQKSTGRMNTTELLKAIFYEAKSTKEIGPYHCQVFELMQGGEERTYADIIKDSGVDQPFANGWIWDLVEVGILNTSSSDPNPSPTIFKINIDYLKLDQEEADE